MKRSRMDRNYRSVRRLVRLAILGMGCTPAAAQHLDGGDSAAHKEIRAVYAHLEQAFKRRDPREMTAPLAEDYHVVFPNRGKMDRNQTIVAYSRQMRSIQDVVAVRFQVDKFTDQGKQVMAEITGSYTVKLVDARAESHEIISLVHTIDTWKRVNGVWCIGHAEVMDQSVLQDGKQVLKQSRESSSSAPGREGHGAAHP